MDEQQRIISCIENSQARIFLEISALDKLHQIQSGLMDDLLTGRVRVTPLLNTPD
jgi:type I restriction enzyme S subunit